MKKGLRVQALVGGSMEPGQNPLQRLRLPDGSGSIAAMPSWEGACVMGARSKSAAEATKKKPATCDAAGLNKNTELCGVL